METAVVDVDLAQWRQAALDQRESGFTFFDWLSAVDCTDDAEAPGIQVICQLLRLPRNPLDHSGAGEVAPREATSPAAAPPLAATLLRTKVTQGQSLGSLTGVFAGAAWHERETHEMFGVDFAGFNDGSGLGLRPLLLPNGFEGNPLRKSFVLASRATRPWPGAKEPGEGGPSPEHPLGDQTTQPPVTATRATVPRRARRRVMAPGVPGPEWGPRPPDGAEQATEQTRPQPELAPKPRAEAKRERQPKPEPKVAPEPEAAEPSQVVKDQQ